MCAISLSNWLDVFEWWSVNTADLARVIVREAIACSGESSGVRPCTVFEHFDIICCVRRLKHDYLCV